MSDEARSAVEKGPDAFRTISEVADELGLPQHVLRFWETRFPQIKPIKRGGGRRYYRPNDVDLLRGVKHLLYGEGYTIRGVQRILREQGGRRVAAYAEGGAPKPDPRDAEALADRIFPLDDLPDAATSSLVAPGSGPELWAPQRRAPSLQLQQAASDGARANDASEDSIGEASDRRATLTADRFSEADVRRLRAALDDLGACRRLLGERP